MNINDKIINDFNIGNNLCITGPAGSGKTYLLNQLRKQIADPNKAIIAAPTGTAALNIDGLTLHSAFKLPISPIGPNEKLNEDILNVMKHINHIFIDEIGSVRFDYLDYIFRHIAFSNLERIQPIQVITMGDWLQIPPVITDDIRPILNKLWLYPYQEGFAFFAPSWKTMNFKYYNLTDVKRQDSQDFIKMVNAIRLGDTSCIHDLNIQHHNKAKNDVILHIYPTKKDVLKHNNYIIDNYPGEKMIFIGNINDSYDNVPVPEHLVVFEGMQVMIIANSSQYKNGQLAIVKSWNKDSIIVESNSKNIELTKHIWENVKLSVSDSIINQEVIGTYEQFPIIPAYAVTIDKIQGQTIDNHIIIDPSAFKAGQLYVALTRVTKPEYLHFTKAIEAKDVIVSGNAIKFTNAPIDFLKTVPEFDYTNLFDFQSYIDMVLEQMEEMLNETINCNHEEGFFSISDFMQ